MGSLLIHKDKWRWRRPTWRRQKITRYLTFSPARRRSEGPCSPNNDFSALANGPHGYFLPNLEEPVPRIAFQESEPMPDIVEREVVCFQPFGDFLPIDRGRNRRLRVRARRVGSDRGGA